MSQAQQSCPRILPKFTHYGTQCARKKRCPVSQDQVSLGSLVCVFSVAPPSVLQPLAKGAATRTGHYVTFRRVTCTLEQVNRENRGSNPGYVIFPEGKGLGLAKFRIISKQNDVCTLERVPYSTYVLHSDIKPESVKRHANAGASRTMVQQLGQPFHADLQPVLAPLETPFDDLPMLVKEKQDRKNDLLASRGASRMVHVAMRELF